MKAEDTNIIVAELKKMLPELTGVQVKIDDITGKQYFVGTTPDNRKARFEITAKITQIAKVSKPTVIE